MKCTDRKYYVFSYTNAYEAIKIAPIFQEAISYKNPETGDTTIMILNKKIWMGVKM